MAAVTMQHAWRAYKPLKRNPRLDTEATIDQSVGPLNVTRTLNASPAGATSWTWSVVRRPALSTAALSSTSVAAPTFVPDVRDRFTFRLLASNAANVTSITDVSLTPPCAVLGFSPATLPSLVRNVAWNVGIAASNGAAPYLFELQVGTLPPGLTLGTDGVLSGTPTTAGTFYFDIVAEDRFGCRGDFSYQITVTAGPTGLTATATAPDNVLVSWTAVPGSPSYRVFRKGPGDSDFVSRVVTNLTPWNDPAAPDTVYVYRVVAEQGANVSGPSNSDLATTMTFMDDPAIPSVTPIRAVHITQLRTAVAAARALVGLPPAAWTASMASVQKDHVAELRTALNDVRSSLALGPFDWTDPTLWPAVTTVKAAHVNELRSGVK